MTLTWVQIEHVIDIWDTRGFNIIHPSILQCSIPISILFRVTGVSWSLIQLALAEKWGTSLNGSVQHRGRI